MVQRAFTGRAVAQTNHSLGVLQMRDAGSGGDCSAQGSALVLRRTEPRTPLELSLSPPIVPIINLGIIMAKKAKKRKYSKSAESDVKSEMHRYKKGKAKSGPKGKGGKVKSKKQAIAIGLSKARKKGKKVPKKKKS